MDRYAVDHPQQDRSNMTIGKGEGGFGMAKSRYPVLFPLFYSIDVYAERCGAAVLYRSLQ
jgi:hypothetical protein